MSDSEANFWRFNLQLVLRNLEMALNYKKLSQTGLRFIALVLLVYGFFFGRYVMQHQTEAPQFYQRDFAPSVMRACGYGFTNPPGKSVKDVDKFLNHWPGSFSCDLLDANEVTAPVVTWQKTHRYLLEFFGFVWKFTGVTWDVMPSIAGSFFALNLSFVFLIMAHFLPWFLALFGAMLYSFSPTQLGMLPSFRDYGKSTFIYVSVFLLMELLLRKHSTRSAAIFLALLGVVLGFGFGFRADLLVYFLSAVVLLVLFFRMESVWSLLKQRIFALSLLVCAFLIPASPVLINLEKNGSDFVHFAFLGLSDSLSSDLVKQPYSPIKNYNDFMVWAQISAYAQHKEQREIRLDFRTHEYNHYGKALLAEYIKLIPYDFVLRGISSTLNISTLFFSRMAKPHVSISMTEYIENFRRIYGDQIAIGLRWMFIVMTAIFALLASFRVFCLAGLSVLFLTAYPAIQYQPRHFFHLEPMSIILTLLILKLIFTRSHWSSIRENWLRLRQRPWSTPFWILPGIALLLGGLGWIQNVRVSSYLKTVLQLPAEDLQVAETIQYGNVYKNIFARPFGSSNAEFLRIKLDFKKCEPVMEERDIRVDIDYSITDGLVWDLRAWWDQSTKTAIKLNKNKPTAVLLTPVYTNDRYDPTQPELFSHPKGVFTHPGDRSCVSSVERIKNPELTPVMLTVLLYADWELKKWRSTINGL